MRTQSAPDAGQGVEGTESDHREVGDSWTTVPPTAADISRLLRTLPTANTPAPEREQWLQRKHAMLAAIERAKR